MAKKTDTNQYPGCLGTTCTDGTCLACQVSQSEHHHEEIIAAIKDLGAHIGDIATELTALRRTLGAPTAPVATPPAAKVKAAEAEVVTKAEPKAETPVAAAPPPPPPPPPAAPKALTIEVVRPLILEWVKANGRDKLVAALAEFGAAKLPDVKDADLQKLVDRLGIKV